jgi:diketogulonate reductase-like aldo/keto reductase
MRYKILGRTGVEVASVGVGCMGIGGALERSSTSDRDHVRALEMAIDCGMIFLDTAEVYGQGHSEELVGQALRGKRDNIFVASKVSPEHLGYHDVIKAAEASLRRLRIDRIDLYQVHWPNPRIPIQETMNAMETLRSEEKIRFIGLSNFSTKELNEAEASLVYDDVASIQVEYNLFDRSIENSVLPRCEEKRITTIAYSPLDQGRIASSSMKLETLKSIAEKYQRSPAQITLNWLIRHPSVVAIPKATNPKHIKENAQAADFDLADEDFDEICRVFTQESANVPTDRICVVEGGQGNRQVYQTIQDALENKLGFIPSPADLARSIRRGEMLKPVRVVPTQDRSGRYDYDRLEGRIRYWAWVIAHEGRRPIPVCIRA